MSKCKKYVKGGGINPFWVMEQMGKYDEDKSDYGNNGMNLNININIGDLHINGSFEYDKKKPNSNKNLAIKKVSEDS